MDPILSLLCILVRRLLLLFPIRFPIPVPIPILFSIPFYIISLCLCRVSLSLSLACSAFFRNKFTQFHSQWPQKQPLLPSELFPRLWSRLLFSQKHGW